MRVAIVIPTMGRTEELRSSLPSLLAQDYPDFSVYLVDHGSTDGLAAVVDKLRSDRLTVLGCPRPEYFSFARGRNIGVRYSSGELLLFVNGDNVFESPHVLSDAVASFLAEPNVDWAWFASWRRACGYDPVTTRRAGILTGRYRNVFCHTHGSVLLVERTVFQDVGGFNELLEDWGYEDTDLASRLELSGLGRIEMKGVGTLAQPDEEGLRVRFFRHKDPELTWLRNRLLSDYMIGRWGHVLGADHYPGRCSTITIDHRERNGLTIPQQDWYVRQSLSAKQRAYVRALAAEYSRVPANRLRAASGRRLIREHPAPLRVTVKLLVALLRASRDTRPRPER